jgi:integrase
MPILTDNSLELQIAECRRTGQRVKLSDNGKGGEPGFYVSITPAGEATFALKRPVAFTIGLYRPAGHPQAFSCAEARQAGRDLKARIGREGAAAVAATVQRRHTIQLQREGLTIKALIKLRIDAIKAPDQKADGEIRPLVESWSNIASHLNRFVAPDLGHRLAEDVTRGEIIELADKIRQGHRGGKPSRSNARHMCKAMSGMFNWAIDRELVTNNPTTRLIQRKKAGHKEACRTRNLTAAEIKTFWHGLDGDLPHDRRTRLALKFELVSMLRGGEFASLRKDEVFDLDGAAYVRIPLKRVKSRQGEIVQPLSTLAVAIIKEALQGNDTDYVFASPNGGNAPLSDKATATALRDRADKGTKGICSRLGIPTFKPHDLRRTGATVGRRVATKAAIALCLNHAVKHEDGMAIPSVTDVYVHADEVELAEKRETLEKLAGMIRRIVDEPPHLRLVA